MNTLKKINILIMSVAIIFATVECAYALPKIEEVVSGDVEVKIEDSKVMTINASNNSIVNYSSFNIAQNESVFVTLPETNSRILNRVVGNEGSEILGRLDSNGIFILVNQNGIRVGETAQINAGSLILSTRDITDTNFINGEYLFEKMSQKNLDMLLLYEGKLTISDGGFGVLIAGAIENKGIITASLGKIALAGGDAVKLNIAGNRLISIAIEKKAASMIVDYEGNRIVDQIENKGRLEAKGGVVILNAESITDVFRRAIRLEGFVVATRIDEKDGEVLLSADGDIVMNAEVEATNILVGAASSVIPAEAGIYIDPRFRGDDSRGVPENIKIEGGSLHAEESIRILSSNDLDIAADLISNNGNIVLYAGYMAVQPPRLNNKPEVFNQPRGLNSEQTSGDFRQLSGIIETRGEGNISIDALGKMTLGTIKTELGAIKIGTLRAPKIIEGSPHFIHSQGDFEITKIDTSATPGVATVYTSRGDVLKYATDGKVTLEALNGRIVEAQRVSLPAEHLELVGREFMINSGAITTHLYNNVGDVRIEEVRVEEGMDLVTLLGPGVGEVTYFRTNNITFEVPLGSMDTAPGVIIPANQVRISSQRIGSYDNPVGINADTTYINRLQGTIDISEMWGLGSTLMIRGPAPSSDPSLRGAGYPPKVGRDEAISWGAVSYNRDSHLVLDAEKVTISGENPTHLYGNITFHNLEVTAPGKVIYFEAGKTYTFEGSTYIYGQPGYEGLIKLLSSEEGRPFFTVIPKQDCHPERSEGSYERFLAYARNDNAYARNDNVVISYVALRDAHNLGETVKARPSTNWGNSTGWDLDPVWDGQGATTNWSEALNWDTNTVPTEFDTVTFDSTSIKDSTVDAHFGGKIAVFTIEEGYTGTINLNRSLTVTQAFSQDGGKIATGTHVLEIQGPVKVTGGDFIGTYLITRDGFTNLVKSWSEIASDIKLYHLALREVGLEILSSAFTEGFTQVELELISTEALLPAIDSSLRIVKTKDTITNTYLLQDGISIVTSYEPSKNRILGEDVIPIKQTVTLNNPTEETFELELIMRTITKASEITWNGEALPVTEIPLVLAAYDKTASVVEFADD